MTRPVKAVRGYFGVGVEGISKPMNLGAILRTAHAFGASFAFTVDAHHKARDVFRSDTAKSLDHVPYYGWDSLDDMVLPQGCALVGIELTDDAVELPSFRHPRAAAYVLGRERGSLTPEMLVRCEHVVRIPTKFCVNVSVAAALTLYDRTICLGGYPDRPVMPGGPELGDAEGWAAPKSR
ncbi:RNA methyltransferase [Hyphobacterium marinum]|uniref:RNA methyltransferase n=1 Tax=Hyphobacterium marinum TaxID=3116574 RepID=A0ABU7LUR6_9PROT|nr:RNA methyltransferase [Hyphobacterium sp. Y6023]MEE2565302.1 RNA methyltransferase [Hyphobacterium sp. Y6023]